MEDSYFWKYQCMLRFKYSLYSQTISRVPRQPSQIFCSVIYVRNRLQNNKDPELRVNYLEAQYETCPNIPKNRISKHVESISTHVNAKHKSIKLETFKKEKENKHLRIWKKQQTSVHLENTFSNVISWQHFGSMLNFSSRPIGLREGEPRRLPTWNCPAVSFHVSGFAHRVSTTHIQHRYPYPLVVNMKNITAPGLTNVPFVPNLLHLSRNKVGLAPPHPGTPAPDFNNILITFQYFFPFRSHKFQPFTPKRVCLWSLWHA